MLVVWRAALYLHSVCKLFLVIVYYKILKPKWKKHNGITTYSLSEYITNLTKNCNYELVSLKRVLPLGFASLELSFLITTVRFSFHRIVMHTIV